MFILKTLIKKIFEIHRHIQWQWAVFINRSKIKEEKKAVVPDCKILILAPHSDDEWIGCSKIIKENKNVIICNMNMDGGDTEEIHAIRYQEMKSLADKYNRPFFTVNANDREKDLLQIIQDYQPEIIFLPFFMDWHEDHIRVMNMLKSVSATVTDFQIGMYPVSLPMLPNFITHYKPLNKSVLKAKWGVFLNTYKTQTFLPWRRFLANERINGACVNQYAAEVYSIIPVEQWIKLLDNHLLTDKQKKCLKGNLNKISKVRKLMKEFCSAKEV